MSSTLLLALLLPPRRTWLGVAVVVALLLDTPLTGFDAMGAGTGASNPALAENGVVHMHPGIAGSADLDFATVETEVRRGMEDWTRVSRRYRRTRIESHLTRASQIQALSSNLIANTKP